MPHWLSKTWFLPVALMLSTTACATTTTPVTGYTDAPAVQQFIADMVARHDFDKAELDHVFSQARRRDDILELMSKPAEKKLAWFEYRKIFLTRSRIDGGVAFWRKNADILAKAAQEFGVDAQIIVAIIGVETRYGANTGRHRVLDALSTLAFDYPPRSKFFRSELEQFLLLAREEDIDQLTTRGSYAGAMGYGQFIPSSYRNYAVDFSGDGKRDLWGNQQDIIGSVANYFHKHGWQAKAPVTTRANLTGNKYTAILEKGYKPNTLLPVMRANGITAALPLPDDTLASLFMLEQQDGPEYWLGLKNFYVITRYNHSPLYAMAAYQLSEEIRKAYAQEQQANHD
ncbi:MAG: lytic murein transglycosylase B [Gammaproteobacteria bacterium]